MAQGVKAGPGGQGRTGVEEASTSNWPFTTLPALKQSHELTQGPMFDEAKREMEMISHSNRTSG